MSMVTRRGLCLLAMGVLCAACPGDSMVPPDRPPPLDLNDCVVVSDEEVLVADVELVGEYDGVPHVVSLPIENVCDVAIDVGVPTIDIDRGPAMNQMSEMPVIAGMRPGGLRIAAGTTESLVLRFDPEVQGTTRGVVRLQSGPAILFLLPFAATAREARIDVDGTASEEATEVGCDSEVTLHVHNPGKAPLEIYDIDINREDLGFSVLELPELPLVLEPGEQASAVLLFSPEKVGNRGAHLVVQSNAWQTERRQRVESFAFARQALEPSEHGCEQ